MYHLFDEIPKRKLDSWNRGLFGEIPQKDFGSWDTTVMRLADDVNHLEVLLDFIQDGCHYFKSYPNLILEDKDGPRGGE